MPATKALVLVNTNNSVQFDQKCFPEGQTPIVPTVVIGKRAGEKIIEFLRQYGRDLKVKIQCAPFGNAPPAGKVDEEEAGKGTGKEEEEVFNEDEWDVILSTKGMYCACTYIYVSILQTTYTYYY